jgi:hypothetical protein
MKPRIALLGLDGWGVSASTACAVHCALTALLPGLPILGVELLLHPACEMGLLLLCSLLAAGAMLHGVLRGHGHWWPAALFVAGLLGIWIAHFALEDRLEVGVSVAAAVVLASAHAANFVCGRHCAATRAR